MKKAQLKKDKARTQLQRKKKIKSVDSNFENQSDKENSDEFVATARAVNQMLRRRYLAGEIDLI